MTYRIQVSGDVDTIKILTETPLDKALEEAKEAAIQNAIQKGANPNSVSIVEVDYIPLAYVTNKATRIVVKAAGELDISSVPLAAEYESDLLGEEGDVQSSAVIVDVKRVEEASFDPVAYKPKTDPKTREWILSEIDVEWIAEGCGNHHNPTTKFSSNI